MQRHMLNSVKEYHRKPCIQNIFVLVLLHFVITIGSELEHQGIIYSSMGHTIMVED